MGNATSLALTITIFLVCLTGLSIYTAFGPPNRALGDPYEDHED